MSRVWRFALNGLRRELRAGELLVLMLALVIAVGSITAISFLTDRIGRGVAQQATEVLAADLRLRSGRPMDAERLTTARDAGLQAASAMNFPSVVFRGEERALVNLKAVSDGYPLRGELRTAERLFGAPEVTTTIPAPGRVFADAALLARLGVNVGDRVDVGALSVVIDRVLVYRPDQSAGFSGLAPTLLINITDIPASGLLAEGSRVSYTQLFAGDQSAIEDFTATLTDKLPDGVRLENQADAGSQLSIAIDRAGRFLSLASLVSLILAAVAVAMAARRYAERRLDTAALMKTFGAQQSFVLQVSIVHILVIGVIASAIGTALGFFAERGLSALLSGWLRGDLPKPGWTPAIPGAVTALVLLAGFALPSLLQLKQTPPLRVLRHDLAPPPPGIWLTYGAALLAMAALVWWAVQDIQLLLVIILGTAATGAVLFFAGRVLVSVLSRFRSGVGVSWRYGLANVSRRGASSAIQVVAFGLGLMVLLLLTLVRNDLLAGWRSTIVDGAPNQFLINIQPDERASVREQFVDAGWDDMTFVPLVRGRITAVNGEAASNDPETRRARTGRELNLTWSATLDPSNEVVAGEFWPEDYAGEPLVSVDEDVAKEMQLSIGDTLTFDFAGQPLTARVTSFRAIDWESFRPNFFMVLSAPGMQAFPQTYITSLFVSADQSDVLVRVVRAHPSISVIDIDAAIARVRSIIDKASLAVQYVFLFTLAAGLVVLFAAIQSTLDERRYESALLRTFGATRRTILSGILAEFSALGLLAGLCAATGASVIGWVAARELFELEIALNPWLWLAGLLAGWLMVGVSGTLAARSAAETPPVQTLRRLS
ncbi:MAG: FtsX-like permease family protein [Pseudomonadota bacterium]